ncbi:MAG TPA: winged helix DNA-binding domain-containing protein [Actinomycetota bacterium]|nr:winged helix DNA-binding domain-containing protein [Actinomycetota bacterium]
MPRRMMLNVASELCGLHAQVMSSAELTLWARVEGLGPEAVKKALWKDRSLVKLWAMRGTLHLLTAADYPTWQAALSTYDHYRRPGWSKYFGVTQPQLEKLIGAVAHVLEDRELTREELADEVGRRTRSSKLGETLRESWGAVLKPCSFQGVLCFAPGEGQRVRFTNPGSWLDLDDRRPDPAHAVSEVFRRFIKSYGPVSREELARWWTGVSPAGAEKSIRAMGDEVAPVDIEGTRTWMLADHLDGLRSAAPTKAVRLLPAFDQYVIGSTKHAVDLMPGNFRDRVHRTAGWVSPVLAVDGKLEGVWSHERTGTRLSVTIEPFAKQPPWVRRGAEAEAERLAAHLGGSLELTWSG